MTRMFAGHDTSTSTLSCLFHELAGHPEALARLQAEADAALGGETPTAAQLFGELPYLDMVVDETLRLYPPAWIGPRRAVRLARPVALPPGARGRTPSASRTLTHESPIQARRLRVASERSRRAGRCGSRTGDAQRADATRIDS